jgi:CheY-like chemotaxis protein
MSSTGTISGKRILLADDQSEVRETVRLLLGLDGHSVAEAANGEEALGLFELNRYDLVITDYAMPVMRGDELAANIKHLAPTQPILMITGSAELYGGCKARVDAFLEKPFGCEELRRIVAGLTSPPEVQNSRAAGMSAVGKE